ASRPVAASGREAPTAPLPPRARAWAMKSRRHPYRSLRARPRHRGARRRLSASGVFALAALFGAAAGAGWTGTSPEQKAAFVGAVKDAGIAAGMVRERSPQEGDYWRRCDDARAAGTAPIYRGEPGYREGLDRDNDGIACEPYPG